MGWKRKLQYWRKLRRHYCEFGLKLLSSFSITDFKENLHCVYDCYASYCLFWLFSDWNMKLVWFRSSIPCFWNAKLFLNQNKNLLEPWQNHFWGTVQSSSRSSSIEAGNNCLWWTLPKQVIAVVRNWNLSWRHCSTYTFYVKWELIWLKFLCYTFTLIYTYVGQRVL